MKRITQYLAISINENSDSSGNDTHGITYIDISDLAETAVSVAQEHAQFLATRDVVVLNTGTGEVMLVKGTMTDKVKRVCAGYTAKELIPNDPRA